MDEASDRDADAWAAWIDDAHRDGHLLDARAVALEPGDVVEARFPGTRVAVRREEVER